MASSCYHSLRGQNVFSEIMVDTIFTLFVVCRGCYKNVTTSTKACRGNHSQHFYSESFLVFWENVLKRLFLADFGTACALAMAYCGQNSAKNKCRASRHCASRRTNILPATGGTFGANRWYQWNAGVTFSPLRRILDSSSVIAIATLLKRPCKRKREGWLKWRGCTSVACTTLCCWYACHKSQLAIFKGCTSI